MNGCNIDPPKRFGQAYIFKEHPLAIFVKTKNHPLILFVIVLQTK
jgi:hypothetical protein